MPVQTYRQLTARDRTRRNNRQLGAVLALTAGAVNAGGFLAVHRYTSHMTGVISAVADNLALGEFTDVLAGVAALISFICGAATTAIVVNWARRRAMHAEFALPLLLEAILLLAFGLLGAHMNLRIDVIAPSTALLLCFLMGLQNAVVTKVSNAEVRTTHMTGIVTDLGLELGRLTYWNRSTAANERHFVRANREKLLVHGAILGMFFIGAVTGALAFKHLGYSATVPLALALLALGAPPLMADFRAWRAHA